MRKGRVSEHFATYSITKCLRIPAVLHPRQRRDVVDAFLHERRRGRLFLHAFVVMPDHWHCLLTLIGDKSLPELVHDLCRHASFPSRAAGRTIAWEKGFYDRYLRPDESVAETARYIEANPVRKGLTAFQSDWPWSSAHPRYESDLDRHQLGFRAWE